MRGTRARVRSKRGRSIRRCVAGVAAVRVVSWVVRVKVLRTGATQHRGGVEVGEARSGRGVQRHRDAERWSLAHRGKREFPRKRWVLSSCPQLSFGVLVLGPYCWRRVLALPCTAIVLGGWSCWEGSSVIGLYDDLGKEICWRLCGSCAAGEQSRLNFFELVVDVRASSKER